MLKVRWDRQAFRRRAAEIERERLDQLERVAKELGRRIVLHLQGYTGVTVSPRPITAEEEARIRARVESRFARGLASEDPKARESVERFVERLLRQRIAKLRNPPSQERIAEMRAHLEEVYGSGLDSKNEQHRKRVRGYVEMLIRSDLGRLKRQRAKAAARKRHPGHWADKTEELMQSYGFRVDRRGSAVVLTVFNEARYAMIVEARTGYFVVRGTLDRGTESRQILVDVVRDMGLDWKVRA